MKYRDKPIGYKIVVTKGFIILPAFFFFVGSQQTQHKLLNLDKLQTQIWCRTGRVELKRIKNLRSQGCLAQRENIRHFIHCFQWGPEFNPSST